MRILVRTRHNVRVHIGLAMIKSQRKVIIDDNKCFYEVTLLDNSRIELSEPIPSIPIDDESKNFKVVTRIKK